MKASFVTLLLTTMLATNSFAHGMNKPGPNNGYVRMPGTYHVELLALQNVLRVYFLDIGFKALPIKNATAKVSLKGMKEVAVECSKEEAFFRCDTKESNMNSYKEILVKTSKNGENEAISTYKLPLGF